MIAILALQGAFAEHQQMLQRLGVESTLIRNLDDWMQYVSSLSVGNRGGLIIPGGESTTIMRIIQDEKLFSPIREAILGGLPVLGTCAGLIMLDPAHLDTMQITVHRNAYGRQLGSFRTYGPFRGITDDPSLPEDRRVLPMTFIRAPFIESVAPEVEILAVVDNRIVAARHGNQIVTAFHPELDDDTRIHEFFLRLVNS